MEDIEDRIYGGGEDAIEAAMELVPQWYDSGLYSPEDDELVVVRCVMPDTGEVRVGITRFSEDSGWVNIRENYAATITHWTYVPDMP